MKLLNRLYSDLLRFRNSPELKKSIVYVGATSTAYGIVFFQNFLFAFIFSLDFFGKVTLLISLFSTLYVLFTFGLNTVVLRFSFDKKYESDRHKFISHIVTCWGLMGIAISLLLLLAGYTTLYMKHLLPIDYFSEFIPVLFGAFLFSSTEIFPNFFIVREKPLYYAASMILVRGTIFLFLLAAFYFFGESTPHISLMLFFSGLGLSLLSAFAFKVFPIVRLNMTLLKEIFVFSFPLMIYALGGIGYSHGYRVIISNWLNYENQAIFSFTNQLSQIYYLTAASILTGFYPKAYRALEENFGDPHAIRFYLKILIYLGLLLAIGFIPVTYLFLKYFKEGAFSHGFQILPILLFGQFVLLIYGYNYILCTFYKQTKILTYSMLAGVAFSLVLASILLKNGNLWGASLPITGGLIVQFFLSLILVKRAVSKAYRLKQNKALSLGGNPER